MRSNKSIYISEDLESVWDEICEKASNDNRGVGYYLCKIYQESSQTAQKGRSKPLQNK